MTPTPGLILATELRTPSGPSTATLNWIVTGHTYNGEPVRVHANAGTSGLTLRLANTGLTVGPLTAEQATAWLTTVPGMPGVTRSQFGDRSLTASR